MWPRAAVVGRRREHGNRDSSRARGERSRVVGIRPRRAARGAGGVATQPLDRIVWQTPVDLAPQYLANGVAAHPLRLAGRHDAQHRGVPVKTGAAGGFRVEARAGATGALAVVGADRLLLPPHNWMPRYNVALTQRRRLYCAGRRRQAALCATTRTRPAARCNASCSTAPPPTTPIARHVRRAPCSSTRRSRSMRSGNVFFGFHVTGAEPGGAGERHRARRARRHRHLGRRAPRQPATLRSRSPR